MVLFLLAVTTMTAGAVGAVRRYAPSNMLIRRVLTRRGLRLAVPIAVAAAAAYAAAGVAATVAIDAGGPRLLYVVVLVAVYNTVRFVVLIPVATFRLVAALHRERNQARRTAGTGRDGTPQGASRPDAVPVLTR